LKGEVMGTRNIDREEWFTDHIEDYDVEKEEAWTDHMETMLNTFIDHNGYGNDAVIATFLRLSWQTLKYVEYDVVSYSEELLEYSTLLNKRWEKIAVQFSEWVEEFDFPEEDVWLEKEYEGFLGSLEDEKYEEYRDRQMGL
jgi:hypothetical protein